MFFCFGSFDINPVDDELLELLELGVKLLGGLCGQFLQSEFGFFTYVPDGAEIELPFICSFKTLYFFFQNGILTNILLFNSFKNNLLLPLLLLLFKQFSFSFLKMFFT